MVELLLPALCFVPHSVSDLEHNLCASAFTEHILQSPLRSTDATDYSDTT